jgi:predicted DNA-binding protein with PD1-like motif
MTSKKAGDRYVLRFETGDRLVASLAEFCRKRRIGAGTFTGIGSCRRAELGFFDPKTKAYAFKTFRGPREIAALVGNISVMDGRPFVHAHAVLGGRDFRTVGGHLREAEILAGGEVVLTVLPGKLVRRRDEQSGTFKLAGGNPLRA